MRDHLRLGRDRQRLFAALLALGLVLAGPSRAMERDPAAAQPSSGMSPLPGSGFDARMLRSFHAMVNEIRARPRDCGSAGRFAAAAPVDYDARLASASLVHVTDMIERDYFRHASLPDRNHRGGLKVADRIRAAGYPWTVGVRGVGTAAAEVLGYGQRSFAQVFDDWLASPSHCAAIMGPTLRQFGVAARFGANDMPVWAMVLARPPR
jgi:uncharacterized protein YkwD